MHRVDKELLSLSVLKNLEKQFTRKAKETNTRDFDNLITEMNHAIDALN